MALISADRVLESSTSTGTGTFSLGGVQSGAYQGFVAGIGNGNTCQYCIANPAADEWEVGIGTVTDATPDTLSRDTVLASSNADALVNFSSGTKDVFVVQPAGGSLIMPSGSKILYGDTSAYALEELTPAIQLNGAIGTPEGIGIYHWSSSAGAHYSALTLARSRNNTIGTHQAVINNDCLGKVQWNGSDGTNFLIGAEIEAVATGAWTDTDNRSEIQFNITKQGASDPQLAMRVTDTGTVYTGYKGNDLRGVQHGSLTVHTGNSGATAALTSADELLVEAGSNGGITVFTPDDNTGKLMFGSASDNNSASVEWTYGTAGATTQLNIGTNVTGGKITFYTGANAQALEIEADGTLNVAGITNYENLVTADDDIPNKKYVDDAIASGGSDFTITTTAVNKTLANREKCSVTASGRTITLPATPSNGHECWVSVGNFDDTTVARNGSTIEGVADDAVINLAYKTVLFYYNGSTWLTRS